ncbi:MAG: ClpXP protease specificity-enhancing factor [Betaproteobacteria bacterium]|nr:ClpXP protease specificity-enhancing factor [Betaproteobacteria bacterium]
MSEPSTKPYLMRAIYDWCVDSGYTPYLTVTVDALTRVPMEYVKDGQIVLNIGPIAVERFKMGNELIEFSARFNGAGREISIPIGAVSAIYARENGQGLSFELSAPEAAALARPAEADQGNEIPPEPPRPSGKPSLRRVK